MTWVDGCRGWTDVADGLEGSRQPSWAERHLREPHVRHVEVHKVLEEVVLPVAPEQRPVRQMRVRLHRSELRTERDVTAPTPSPDPDRQKERSTETPGDGGPGRVPGVPKETTRQGGTEEDAPTTPTPRRLQFRSYRR